jgi:hypothetical protein
MCHFFTSTHIHQCKGRHTNTNLSVHTDFIRFHLRSLCSFAPGDALLGALLFPQWYSLRIINGTLYGSLRENIVETKMSVRRWVDCQSLTELDTMRLTENANSKWQLHRLISWHLPHNELWSLGNLWDLKKIKTLRTLRTPIFTSFYIILHLCSS